MNKSPWHEANKEKLREYHKAYAKKYRAENRERIRATNTKWYYEHWDKQAEYGKKRYQRNRDWYLEKKYGLEKGEYARMLQTQEGRCAICRDDTAGGRGTFHVDHCHATGVVRGLLCNFCNRMIGLGKDSPRIMQSAALYLEKFDMRS